MDDGEMVGSEQVVVLVNKFLLPFLPLFFGKLFTYHSASSI